MKNLDEKDVFASYSPVYRIAGKFRGVPKEFLNEKFG